MRTKVITRAVIVLVGICATVHAQDKAAIIKKLQSEYALTKTTADQTDIVTAGAVLVLQKDNLLMVATTTSGNPCPNTYKDGKFSQNGACRMSEKFKKVPLFGHTIPGADKAQVTSRAYVTGEKFWVTRIDIKDGKDAGVVMDFFTDAVSDVRYRTSLTIPFKGAMPSADDALKLVQEVITVAPSDDDKDKKEAKGNGGKGAPQGGQQAAPRSQLNKPPLRPRLKRRQRQSNLRRHHRTLRSPRRRRLPWIRHRIKSQQFWGSRRRRQRLVPRKSISTKT